MTLGNWATLKAMKRKTIDIVVGISVNGSDLNEQTFRLREMSGAERDRFEIAAFKESTSGRVVDPLYLRSRLVAMCWIDDDGARVVPDEKIPTLAEEASASFINQMFEAAQKLNGLDAAAVEAAGKNSASVPAGASPSDLH